MKKDKIGTIGGIVGLFIGVCSLGTTFYVTWNTLNFFHEHPEIKEKYSFLFPLAVSGILGIAAGFLIFVSFFMVMIFLVSFIKKIFK